MILKKILKKPTPCSQLESSINFIGKQALKEISRRGIDRQIRGIVFGGEACPPCQHPWRMNRDGQFAGIVTTAIWSPRFKQNVALGMVEKNFWNAATQVEVESSDGLIRKGFITDLPMRDDAIKALLQNI